MKASHAKKAFSDPQNLAATPEVAAALIAKLQQTPLQVDQRYKELEAVFAASDVFLTTNTLPLNSLISSSEDSSCADSSVRATVEVLDKNFGAGLDFLLTWKIWQQASEHHCLTATLSYLAICEQPLCLDDIKHLHQSWPQLEDVSLQLQGQYPDAIKGFHQLDFGKVKLIIVQAEPEHALAQIHIRGKGKGQGKFNVCLGDLEANTSEVYTPPWQRPTLGVTQKSKVAIIGAGISGASTAYSLSQRGFDVTLIERGPMLASGASGNRQGMLYAKLPDNATIAGQFHQQGLQHSMALLKQRVSAEYWQACGLLQLATNPKQVAQMQAVMKREYPSSWLQWLDQDAAERLAQQPLSAGGLYFPNSGWVSPVDWCESLYTQSGAQLCLNTDVVGMRQTHNQAWQLTLAGDHSGEYQFDAVVIANANGAKDLLPKQFIPLKSIRGQVSYVDTSIEAHEELGKSPALVVCGEGYVTPAQQGVFAVGASYNFHTVDTALSAQDHTDNLARLSEVLPKNNGLGLNSIAGGRVGFRAVTPDYLPMVGQLADESKVLDRFAKLRQDANYKFADAMPYLTGLYINAGHGSKGLITAPLSAEILACQMANQSLPVAQCVAWGLDPNRFIIRDLIRRKR